MKIEEVELIPTEDLTVRTTSEPVTPMSMLQMAVSKGADLDQLQKLMDLQERWEANEAKKAFAAAMSRAQAKVRQVSTDAENPQTRSKYATYAAIDRAIRPIYVEEGFALSFDTGETPLPDHMRVLCHVSHKDGHTRLYHADIPSDGKGAKGNDVMTKTHAAGSAMAYGMRYLVKMIFNVAIGEYDNDGNGAVVPVGELLDRLEWIRNAETVEKLHGVYTDAYKWATAAKDKNAQAEIIRAKDKRKAELGGAK